MKKIFTQTLLIGLIFIGFANLGEAHFLSSFEERQVGVAATKEYEQKHPSNVTPTLTHVQDVLIFYNSDVLNKRDNTHKRWIAEVKQSNESTVNGLSFPGGFTYITKDMVDLLNTIKDDGYTDMINYNANNDYYLYNNGTIGFVMAHEFAHYVNEDYLAKMDKKYSMDFVFGLVGGKQTNVTQAFIENEAHKLVESLDTRQGSLSSEKNADSTGMDLVENVPQYSIGNAAIFFYRLGNLQKMGHVEKDWQNPHPETAVRLKRVLDHMEDISNGIVKFKDNKFYLNGKLFMGTGLMPAKEDVTAQDRTYYVAGQIASAVKLGMWNPEGVAALSEKKLMNGSEDKTVLCLKNTKKVKIIDSFDLPYDAAFLKKTLNKNTITADEKNELTALDMIIKGIDDPTKK